jgi:ribosomal protein S18 acetylase RimI-like enzyme
VVRLIIRPCSESDLTALATLMPPVELAVHRDRFEEQERGETTYLLAWDGNNFAGHLKVRWSGSVHEHVKKQFPFVPEIRRLRVEPSMQGMGIGTNLLAAAESLVARQGFYFVGLCVAVSNTGARRLYERHGYFDWNQGVFDSHWTQRNADGSLEKKSHEVTYMTKAVAPSTRDA